MTQGIVNTLKTYYEVSLDLIFNKINLIRWILYSLIYYNFV